MQHREWMARHGPPTASNSNPTFVSVSDRLKRGAYQAPPVERVSIPKADGRQRPIGKPTLEDNIVQRATVEVLNAIYEKEFLGFSYGARPGRSPHQALDAVTVGSEKRNINWVLDADMRGFYDAIDHEWLVKCVEHRIGDQRVVRHIWKWLKAGVLEDGHWRQQEEGTPARGQRYTSYKVANMLVEFSTSIPRTQLRPGYGDGFRGAPLHTVLPPAQPAPREQGGRRGTSRPQPQQNPGSAHHV